MDNSSNRMLVKTALLTFAALGTVHATIGRADAFDDLELQQARVFQIGDGESRIIADYKKAEPYRVCVPEGRDTVPVTVKYDGQQRKVSVGDCADVTAKVIALAPAARLKEGEVLVGKYEDRR